jgi:hypothetical protein
MKNLNIFFLVIISSATTTFSSEFSLSQRKRQNYMFQHKAAGCHLSKEQRNLLRTTAYLSLEEETVGLNEVEKLRTSRSIALRSDALPCMSLVTKIDKLQGRRNSEKIMQNMPVD